MKKFAILILASALAFSCGPKYVVEGIVSDHDGDKVLLQNVITGQADTCIVKEGKFTFSGPASNQTLCQVRLIAGRRVPNTCYIIPEEGKILVNLDSPDFFEGSGPLNGALQEVIAWENATNTKYGALLENITTDEQLQALSDQYNAELVEYFNEAFKNNNNNPVGSYIFREMYYNIEDSAQLNAFLEGAGELILTDPLVVDKIEFFNATELTSEGKMFVDFIGQDAAGNFISLSDYVCQGKYVRVDFWASWCGPCRREIPNLIKVHEKYGSQIVVLGVPVWDQRPEPDKAIQQLGIKYDQIFVGDDRTPTEKYGIEGIPQIILFAPDGTIFKRDLRGNTIESTIASVLKK